MRPDADPFSPASEDRPAGPSVQDVDGLSARSAAIIACFGLAMLLVNFGRPWVLTFHEVNYAQPAREFLSSGNWLVPRIMGMPNWDKPPLMHWSIAASLAVFGTEAEWAARFPAALSAVLSGLAIAWLAGRWYGDRIGLIAGLVQLTSIYVFKQGRLAEADMMLCAVSTVAMAAFLSGSVGRGGDRPGRGARLLFFGAAGLAFLVKGPVGLALIGAGSGLGAIVERRRPPWRFLLDPVGWLVMIGLVVAWPAAAMLSESGLAEVWWRHNVERFTGDMGGGGKDPFFYLYTSAWLALPWTPLAVAGFLADRKEAGSVEDRSRRRMLLCWIGGMTALLSLSAWKHTHYIIPALPPLSIWAAMGMDRLVRADRWPGPSRWGRAWSAVVEGLPMLAMVGIASGVHVLGGGKAMIGAGLLIVGITATGIWASDRFRRSGKPALAAGVLFATVGASYVVVQSAAMPSVDDYRGQSDVARRFSRMVPEDAEVAVVAIPDPQITYYLPMPVRRHVDVLALAKHLWIRDQSEQFIPSTLYLVGPQFILDDLAEVGIGPFREIDRADSVHPRKTEADRMVVVALEPNLDRVRLIARGHPEWPPPPSALIQEAMR